MLSSLVNQVDLSESLLPGYNVTPPVVNDDMASVLSLKPSSDVTSAVAASVVWSAVDTEKPGSDVIADRKSDVDEDDCVVIFYKHRQKASNNDDDDDVLLSLSSPVQ